MREILSRDEARLGLERLAKEIVKRAGSAEHLALVGICRGGTPLAEHIATLIKHNTQIQVPMGTVDITLYRDDAPTPLPNPRIGTSEVPFDVRTKCIVLVDDVLFTGRTVRAALHALLDYGRSKAIMLAVLVDRGGRELPIQADFVVKTEEVVPPERVEVEVLNDGFRAVVVPA